MYTQGYNDAMSQLGLVTEKTAAPINKQQIQEIIEQTMRSAGTPNAPQAKAMTSAVGSKLNKSSLGDLFARAKVKGGDLLDSARFKGLEADQFIRDQAVTNPYRTMGIAAGGAGALGAGAGMGVGMPTGIAIGKGSERRSQEEG